MFVASGARGWQRALNKTDGQFKECCKAAEPFYSWSFAQFANIYITAGCVVVTSNK